MKLIQWLSSLFQRTQTAVPYNPPQVVVTEVVRLRQDVFDSFSRSIGNPVVSAGTTDLEAGYKLGIQFALARLQEGLVTK
jgi:hypothetical protein